MNYKQTNNKTATYGEKSQSVSELQAKLNSMGANLKVDSMYGPKTQEAYNKYMGSSSSSNSSKYNTSSIESPTSASDLRPTPKLDLPEPEAVNIYDTRFSSLESNLTNLRKSLENTLKSQKESNQPEIDRLTKEQEKITSGMDPTKRATYAQEQSVIQNQIKAAQNASASLEQDFAKKRKMADELEGLLNQANATLGKEKGMPLSQRVLNARTSRTMSDISARAGVLESVFSAIDGNISQAHTIINNAKDAVSASWNDSLNYYNTLLDLNNRKLVNLDDENKKIAEEEVNLIKTDIKKLEETSDYVKNLMIDPDTAQFMADAGVTLSDSIDDINEKIASQARIKEVADIKNEMVTSGYTYVPFPTSTAGLIPITAGGKTLYFKPKPEKTKSKEALSILDVQRLQESYPDADITVGDTEETAIAKINESNSPENQTRRLIEDAKDSGNDYKTVIKAIDEDETIEDKETAKQMAKEIYGETDEEKVKTGFFNSIANFLFK